MNLSAQDVGDEGTTERCCFSNSERDSCYSGSNKRQGLKEVSMVLKTMEEELKESTTAEEREHATNEIIGLGVQEMDESEDFVGRHLELLENELTKITGSMRSAYDLALKMNSNFVNNKKFRVMFLRADEFDAKKAARRMILHFKYKLDLFGEEKLVKEITFDDLSPSSQGCVRTGSFQLLSRVSDKWGRIVAFHFWELENVVSWEDSTRAHWYNIMATLRQDESLQKLGLVFISFGSLRPEIIPVCLKRFHIVSRSLPYRMAAIHKYLINEKTNSHVAIPLFRFIKPSFGLRLQLHIEESVTSCLYNLFLYGIDPAKVPLDDDGQPTTETFLEVLEKQKLLELQQQKQQQPRLKYGCITKEMVKQGEEEERKYRRSIYSDTTSLAASSTATTFVATTTKRVLVVPTSHDVILGSGKRHTYNKGNATLNIMIELEARSYKKATSQFEKSCIALRIIKRMETIGGRFLKTCDDNNRRRVGSSKRNNEEEKMCMLATDQEIRDTVSSRLRTKAQKIKIQNGNKDKATARHS